MTVKRTSKRDKDNFVHLKLNSSNVPHSVGTITWLIKYYSYYLVYVLHVYIGNKVLIYYHYSLVFLFAMF